MKVKTPKMGSWYSEGLYFSCTQCGACCSGAPGYVWLKNGEAGKIAEFLGTEYDEFLSAYTKYEFEKYSLQERGNGDCVFLRRDPMRCEIYEVRPVQCQVWPFWNEILLKRGYWNKTAESCPGMNQGSYHGAEKIKGKLQLYDKN